MKDESFRAFETVLDKLLASPHYGERWGRHWLDVARYSDTKGQFNRQRESSLYSYASTYRDYVIKAFNADKPYDRFVLEQLAADKLAGGRDLAALATLGFLTLGDHFNGNAEAAHRLARIRPRALAHQRSVVCELNWLTWIQLGQRVMPQSWAANS